MDQVPISSSWVGNSSIVKKSAEQSKSEIAERVTIGAIVNLFMLLSKKLKCGLDGPGIIWMDLVRRLH